MDEKRADLSLPSAGRGDSCTNLLHSIIVRHQQHRKTFAVARHRKSSGSSSSVRRFRRPSSIFSPYDERVVIHHDAWAFIAPNCMLTMRIAARSFPYATDVLRRSTGRTTYAFGRSLCVFFVLLKSSVCIIVSPKSLIVF